MAFPQPPKSSDFYALNPTVSGSSALALDTSGITKIGADYAVSVSSFSGAVNSSNAIVSGSSLLTFDTSGITKIGTDYAISGSSVLGAVNGSNPTVSGSSALVFDTSATATTGFGWMPQQVTFRENSPDVSHVSGNVTMTIEIIYNCNVQNSCPRSSDILSTVNQHFRRDRPE